MYKKYPKGLKLTPDKEYLVLENLGIAHKLAHNWYNGVVDFEDLKQQAYLTLVDCATKYDPTTGNKFSTYAYNCISIVLNNYVQSYNKLVKIPLNKIYKIHEYLQQPDDKKEEFRLKAKLTEHDIKFYTSYEMVSMDAQIVDDYDDVTNFYALEEDVYEDSDNRMVIENILNRLHEFIEDETEILVFCEVILNNFDTSTYKEIAKTYGIKQKRVLEIIDKCQHIMQENKDKLI